MALTWVKASGSGASSCVEAARMPDGGVAVRDSKRGEDGPILAFNEREWGAFVNGVRKGQFDRLT